MEVVIYFEREAIDAHHLALLMGKAENGSWAQLHYICGKPIPLCGKLTINTISWQQISKYYCSMKVETETVVNSNLTKAFVKTSSITCEHHHLLRQIKSKNVQSRICRLTSGSCCRESGEDTRVRVCSLRTVKRISAFPHP